jgi:hypothetical protein
MASAEEMAATSKNTASSPNIPQEILLACETESNQSNDKLVPLCTVCSKPTGVSHGLSKKRLSEHHRELFTSFTVSNDTRAKYEIQIRGTEMTQDGEYIAAYTGALVSVVFSEGSRQNTMTPENIAAARLYVLHENMSPNYRVEVRVVSKGSKGSKGVDQTFYLIPMWQTHSSTKETKSRLFPLSNKPTSDCKLIFHPLFPAGTEKRFYIVQTKSGFTGTVFSSHNLSLIVNKNSVGASPSPSPSPSPSKFTQMTITMRE